MLSPSFPVVLTFTIDPDGNVLYFSIRIALNLINPSAARGLHLSDPFSGHS